jgi:hypothetical protein
VAASGSAAGLGINVSRAGEKIVGKVVNIEVVKQTIIHGISDIKKL